MLDEKKIIYIISFLAIVTITSLCGNIFQQGCIQRTRFELDTVRNELATARDRTEYVENTVQQLRDGLDRADEIRRQSSRTVEDIRRNIIKLEEIFDEMESIINSNNYNNSNTGNNDVEEMN